MVPREDDCGGRKDVSREGARRDGVDIVAVGRRTEHEARDDQPGRERKANQRVECMGAKRGHARVGDARESSQTPNTIAVTASQRHSRARASANEAAVTTAR